MWKSSDKKIGAYTLVEILVVMVLAAILSTAVYGMLSWILKQYHNYGNRRYKTEQVLQLSAELDRLFFKATSVGSDNKNTLYFYLHTQEVVIAFEQDYVLRSIADHVDTLHVEASLLSVSELEVKGGQPLVHAAVLSLVMGEEEVKRVYVKQYDARSLLPALPNH